MIDGRCFLLRSYHHRSSPNTRARGFFGHMPAESLVPGYKLVETFGPVSEYETRPSADSGGNEDEEEVEEEVEYVTLEISGIADVDPNLLTSYRLIVSSMADTSLPVFDPKRVVYYVHCSKESNRLTLSHSPRFCACSLCPTCSRHV